MNEAQRFLRYLTPGALFVGEVVLLLCIVDPRIFAGLIDKNNNFFALVATTLVVSGGVGYFLSLCHHFLLWTIYQYCGLLHKWFAIDYRSVLRTAIKANTLSATKNYGVNTAGKSFKPKTMEAWQVNTALWNMLVSDSLTNMEKANETASRLLDIAHGIGAVSCGTIIAPILVAWHYWRVTDCPFLGFMFIFISALFAVVAFRNLYVTTQHAVGFMEIVLWTTLSAPEKPKKVVVNESMFR
jgi:hypothetical protein